MTIASAPTVPETTGARERDLYLDLMTRAVANTIYQDPDVWYGESLEEIRSGMREERGYDRDRRESGADTPRTAHTMVGLKRLANIRQCLESALADGVPGDFVETGVWRGGASIFARAVLQAHAVTDRTVWVCDSFEGMPPSDDVPIHLLNDLLAVSVDTVRENFRRYGLLDEQVRFVQGWFDRSLPEAPIGEIAVLRLDGDLYESTRDALEALYPKVSADGFVIVDDYQCLAPCRHAVLEYRHRHGITEPIHKIDDDGVYWRRAT